MNNLLTSKQVAEQLGVSEYRVRLYAALGQLKGIKLGEPKDSRRFKASRRHWRFSQADIDKFVGGK